MASHDLLEHRIKALAADQASSYGCEAQVHYKRDYPVLVNTSAETQFARDEHCPSSYLMIGNGDGEGGCSVDNPCFDFNGDNVAIGAACWVLLVRRFLSSSAA